MIKRLTKVCSLVLILFSITFLFTACNKESSPTTYTVTFYKTTPNSIYGHLICTYQKASEKTVEEGSVIGEAPVNTKDGLTYQFVGWYTEEGCINSWDLYRDEVRSNLTLYPKYIIKE